MSADSVLLAVSGGLDSMCMLHYFANRRGEFANIYAAYVHHGVREDAERDAELIERECKRYGMEFYLLKVEGGALGSGSNFEAHARAARYKLLLELKSKLGANLLATAHHANDQVETVFLRIARGTGLRGLQGILEKREDNVIRPFLHLTKDYLQKYAAQHGIEWREDSTNSSLLHFRNRVRLQILPQMESEHPEAIKALAHIAALAQKINPPVKKLLNGYFSRYEVAPPEWLQCKGGSAEKTLLLKDFYLPAHSGYWELFKLWLAGKGFSWEESGEDGRFYALLQAKKAFRFKLGNISFEKLGNTLWCIERRTDEIAEEYVKASDRFKGRRLSRIFQEKFIPVFFRKRFTAAMLESLYR